MKRLNGKTRLVVTHNLSVCRHASRIWLLKDGRLAEQGTFEQVSQLPLFSALYASFSQRN